MKEEWKEIYYVDPITKEVIDYRGMYEVSNKGNVRSVNRIDSIGCKRKGQILSQTKDKDGYYKVKFNNSGKRRTFITHRLVALLFLENDDPNTKTFVNHKIPVSENSCINTVENLEWCTPKYNVEYGDCQKKREKTRLATGYQKYIIGINENNNDDYVIYKSSSEAGENGYNYSHVTACCRNHRNNNEKGRKKVGGRFWYYLEDYISYSTCSEKIKNDYKQIKGEM